MQKHPVQPPVKLPDIKINPFSGNISEWNTFIQLLDAVITESLSLSEKQKLVYLKSFLKEEPLKIIESFVVYKQTYIPLLFQR